MEEDAKQTELFVTKMVGRARAAMAEISHLDQDDVLCIAKAIGWLAVNKAEEWANINYAETGMGRVESKIIRTRGRARGLVRELINAKTVGIIEVDDEKQLVKIAKPVGVVASLVPVTVPMGVVFMGAMNAIMGKNATIFAPHPKAVNSTLKAVNDIRALLESMRLPRDLCICIAKPNLEVTNELMRQSDLVVATGGKQMVKAAYSSGTPAYGVGAGNAVAVVDETADLKDAAEKIGTAQLNDYAIGCSTENAVIVQRSIYENFFKEMVAAGAYICSTNEKSLLQNFLWKKGNLNPDALSLSAPIMAEKAGFDIPSDRTWLVVEESGYGPEYLFSGEKLSVVVTAYVFDSFDEAIDLTNGIQRYSGAGHSCGIHSFDEKRILDFALRTYTSRVVVRMAIGLSNAGNWNNGMPFTINLGCGTWGGNIISENLTHKHYINTTWVTREIQNFRVPNDRELFGSLVDKENCRHIVQEDALE